MARVTRPEMPYAGKRHTPDTGRLSALYTGLGEALAETALRKGAITQRGLEQLGSIFTNYSAGKQAEKQQNAVRSQRKSERDEDRAFNAEQGAMERSARASERMSERDLRASERAEDAATRTAERAEAATTGAVGATRPGVVRPEFYDQVKRLAPAMASRFQVMDGAPVLMQTPEQARQTELDAATSADRTADNVRADKTLAATIANRAAPPQRAPVAVIGPDGNPVYVDPSQALGKRPASTREQGRSVTSGDAGRVADFDTSLDDVSVLTKTLTSLPNATGVQAQIGAAIPAWATNLTGWGTDAKKKQAVIDRVKQVIGKALEGGVLRKEDELKYEKILPTIKDDPAIVTSKLEGLEAALTQRRERFLESLADANYDVSKYQARPAREIANPPAADAPMVIDGFTVRVKPKG